MSKYKFSTRELLMSARDWSCLLSRLAEGTEVHEDDASWERVWSNEPTTRGFTESEWSAHRLGHYLGWMAAKVHRSAQEKSAETTPPTKELTEYEKSLWLKEYDRCRNSGDAVRTACKNADDAVREISKRMGKPETPEPSGKVKLAADVYKWDDGCLYVAHGGRWELAGQAWRSGTWEVYKPATAGGDIEASGQFSPIFNESRGNIYDRAKDELLRKLNWESYGLKRTEGL